MSDPPQIQIRPTARRLFVLYSRAQYGGIGAVVVLVIAIVGRVDLFGWAAMGLAGMAAVWWIVQYTRQMRATREELGHGYTTMEEIRKDPDQSHLWLLDDEGNVLIPPGQVWF